MRTFLAVKSAKKKKLSFVAGVVVALASFLAVGQLTNSTVHADCSNDIMCGGFSTPANFISKVENNNDNGHHDLKAIYAHEFVSGESLPGNVTSWDDFAAHAVSGWANRADNTITLSDGTVVATSAKSIGRDKAVQGANPITYTIGNSTYYGNFNSQAIAASSSRLPVWILLDQQGKFQFAVMQSCGNPTFGTAKPSSAQCKDLNATKVNDTTYDFVASTNVTGNATLKKLVYNFGDGTSTTVTSNFGKAVRHSYAQTSASQNLTASVTVYVSVPGRGEFALPSVSLCKHTVTIPPKPVTPVYTCSSLTPATVDASKFHYRFTANASYGPAGTVKIVSADFVFGDGQKQTVAASSSTAKSISVDHTYSANKDYDIAALLHFTVNGSPVVAAHACTSNLTAPTCKPNVPVGDVRCNPCPTNPSIPASDTEECVPPATTLPNTGAGNVIAIVSVVVVGGFLVYRQVMFRRHKAAFIAAQKGISPLPLGDPLNDEAPLAGTPLEPKKRSFRRKRQY